MTKTVITSTLTLERKPLLAFFLSLCITGAGQLYNGSLLRGLIFLAAKSMFLLTLPLFLMKLESYAVTIYCLFSFLLFVIFSIWSAWDAVFINKSFSVSKKYRKPLALTLYLTGYMLLHTFLVIILSQSLGMYTSKGNESPIIKKGEYLLINHISTPKTGQMALTPKGIYRIISEPGETITLQHNNILRNNSLLPLSTLKKSLKNDFTIESDETILIESNNDFKYPVSVLLSQKHTYFKKINLNKEQLFTAKDYRYKKFYIIIEKKQIAGRVEGIISSSLDRMIVPMQKKHRKIENDVIVPVR